MYTVKRNWMILFDTLENIAPPQINVDDKYAFNYNESKLKTQNG